MGVSGKKTLIVDMDPQCNATTGLGFQPVERHPLVDGNSLKRSILETDTPNLDLLPGSRSFRDVDMLANGDSSETEMVVEHLSNGTSEYEFVLVDCPPSLGQLTQTALAASSEIFMPIQCEYFAMEGLTEMIKVIRGIMRAKPGKLQFGGIVLTMYDHSLELTHEVEKQVRTFFGEIVFDTVVPRDVCVSEAPSHGQSVMEYAPRSRGSRAYIELCMEVLVRD